MEKFDPPIQIGSIVAVRSPNSQHLEAYIGVIIHDSTFDPGFRKIMIPGIGEVETSLEACYNATEDERKKYFLEKLTHGQ